MPQNAPSDQYLHILPLIKQHLRHIEMYKKFYQGFTWLTFVLDSQKVGARVLSNACMINQNLIIYLIYDFVFNLFPV